MNHNTQQLISPQDPEWRKIYDNCRSRQGHFTQKVPERQTRITLSAKQNKKLRGVIEHNVQDHDLTLTAPWKNAHDRILRSEDQDAHIIPE